MKTTENLELSTLPVRLMAKQTNTLRDATLEQMEQKYRLSATEYRVSSDKTTPKTIQMKVSELQPDL